MLIIFRYMEKVLQLKCCPAAEKSDKWTRKIYDLLCAILNLWKTIYTRYKEIWSKEAVMPSFTIENKLYTVVDTL